MADVTIPNTIATGQQRAAAKIQQNVEALRDGVNALFPVVDADLASANNSVFRTILVAAGHFRAAQGAGTYPLRFGAASLDDSSPTDLANQDALGSLYIDDADYAVGGLTAKLRVRAQVSTNGTVPAITFTFGLYPVAFSGGADALTATLGAVVGSSTAAIASPAANSAVSGVSSEVNVPADGMYCLGVVTSATLTANAVCMVSAQLQARNV